jgi:hypothetical protein
MQEYKALLSKYKNRINFGIALRAISGSIVLFVFALHLYFVLWLLLGAYSPALIYANLAIRIGMALGILYIILQAWRKLWDYKLTARYLDRMHKAGDDLYQNALELQLKDKENPISKALLVSARERLKENSYSIPKPFSGILLITMALFLMMVFGFWLLSAADFGLAFKQFYSNRAPRIIYNENIVLSPGDITIGKHQPLLIRIVDADARLESRLYYRVGENWRELALSQNSYLFPRLEQSIEYYAENEISKSPIYKIRVLDEPIVKKWELTYNYPEYTALPSYTDSLSYGNIEAYKGTLVHLRVSSNIPLKSATMVYEDASRQELVRVDSLDYIARIVAQVPRSWYLELEDTLGRKSRPEEKSIRILPDDPPQIRIVFPGEDITLNQNLMLPLIISADDDFGLVNCNLQYQVNADSVRSINVQSLIAGKMLNRDYLWNMQDLDLFPGDVVSYWAEIYDNSPQPQRGISNRYRARFPSIEEIYAEIEEQEEIKKDELSSSLSESEKLQERYEQKRRELLKDPELAWEDKKELEDIIAKQEELGEQVENVAQSYQELIDKMQANSTLSQDTLQKMMKIQELMQEIATQEMLDAMQKLEQAMENVNPEALKKALEDFKFSMEDFAEKIEQTLALLESIKQEQAVQKALQISEETERLQKALQEQTADADTDTDKLAQDQQQIAEKYDKLQAELEKIKELMKDEAEYQKQLNELMQDMQESKARQDMQQSKQSLSQQDRQKAMQAQESVLEKLRRFTNKLAEMKESMSSGSQGQMMQALERAIREILIFSKDHEQIASGYLNDPYPLVPDLIAAYEGLQISLNNLFSKPMVSMLIPPKFYMDLNETNKAYRDIFGILGQSFTPNISRHLDSVQKGLNLMAHDLMIAMQNASSGGGGGGGMQSLMQMLEQMGQEQMAMNMLTQQLMMQMQAQGGTMDAAMQEQVGKLASDQERLAENLKRALQNDPQAQKQGNAIKQIIEEAESIARSLRQNQFDNELLRRQENILSRLLDAQKSINKRDTSERRQAESSSGRADEEQPIAVDYDRLRRAMMLDEGFKDYPREYQQLIMEYLKLLEEERIEN